MANIDINFNRLNYLLELFDFNSIDEFAKYIGLEKIQNPLTKGDLQKIDAIFKRGLDFYTNPNSIINKSSILFRKNNIKEELSIGDKQLISKMEQNISYITGLAKLTNFDFTSRKLEKFSINDKPCEVATQMQFLLDKNISDDKKFLKYFIDNLAKHNILVIEEVQHSNLKFKSNLCGFFMKPNIIVLRKQQSRKREIFTLAHELGHYLLTHEHIDKNIFDESVDLEEKWCNEFAFNFLIGSEIDELNNIAKHDIDINNEMILEISKKKHISRLAIFYYYTNNKKISWQRYHELNKELEDDYKNKLEISNSKGTIYRQPKPIISSLKKDIFIDAFLNDIIDEYIIRTEFSKEIKNDDFEGFIYG
ncbi:DUF955 domain-containing protein [Campylobacter volucris]|uniref:DUF955 domain-containing protein n=2 Tax=Campylobacter TaxID=194 RepID=A0AAE5YJB8_9BACT|nr:DUF955 domain-containing protein [Campylobacter volucris]AJC93680.1 hypothetical protein (DUF955 domain) [Campylobacter volucris LMG 24379]KAB0579841.1 DUF955 domain-containing protein [Campylobacter volucris]QBL13938.1 DUF955 domain-containing protein [Campylobacter volucris]QEL07893.1 zinc-dependent peptidase, M78 family (DUF955 domain) [Campylobacter volucris]TXK70765.1 DUF955 domain-containing protein [Campylobacter volucris]